MVNKINLRVGLVGRLPQCLMTKIANLNDYGVDIMTVDIDPDVNCPPEWIDQ